MAREPSGLTRTFGGKRFTLSGTHRSKREAQSQAKRFREGGESARVVKDPGTGQWAVFVRFEKGRGPR